MLADEMLTAVWMLGSETVERGRTLCDQFIDTVTLFSLTLLLAVHPPKELKLRLFLKL